MKTCLVLAASLAALGLPAFAAVDVQVSSAAKAQAYRKVMIAPARVELDRDFLPSVAARGQFPRITRGDVDTVAREMGASFEAALAEAFRASGFEVVRAPGADVLALSPSLKDLRVNAPEGSSAGSAKVYVREAGQATMEVEGRDSAGSRVVYASELRTAGRITEFSRATDVSNRFWFDTMFRRWAKELASGLARAR